MSTPALLIDLGNTRLKWAWYADGRLDPGGALVHRGQPLGPLLHEAFRGAPTPGAVHVCAVAARDTQAALRAWLQGRWPLLPHFVRVQREGYGVVNGYHDYRQLGVDRWVALIAARHWYGDDLCLFDCGSALTFDAIDREGRHLGGAILPGLGLMRRQLQGELGLEVQNGEVEPNLLAKGTEDGIATGTLHAAAAFVERALARMDGDWSALLTGGDAQTLAPHIARPVQLEPLLVLKGLATIADLT